jgi:hypothetical protein
MVRKIYLPAALLAACVTSVAQANPAEGEWTTTFSAGATFAPRATMLSGVNGALADLGVIDPTLAGASATTSAGHLAFGDAFRTGPTAGLEMSYGLSSQLEPFMRFDYEQLGGRNVGLATVSSTALATPAIVSADFGDLRSSAVTVGARYFFLPSGALQPFLSGFVGANHTDAVRADLAAAALALNLGRQTLLPAATRFTAGAEAGLGYALSDHSDLRFSLGADYISSQRALSDALDPLGITSVAVNDRRWSFPAELGVSYRF